MLYLSERALAGTEEIHEQEVGHEVFGRPRDYDTSSDNIVRVHASTLRKRLEQYFAEEGSAEPLILEIPKGNYAPVFRRREPPTVHNVPPVVIPPPARRDRPVAILAGLAGLFALSTVVLLVRGSRTPQAPEQFGPTVRAFWAEVFRPAQATDVVLDDATLGLYQELTNAAAAFLSDESAMQNLRRQLPGTGRFPRFEALVRVKGRSTRPGDAVVVICRPARA